MLGTFRRVVAIGFVAFLPFCRCLAGELDQPCSQAQERGIAFLAASQQKNGNFLTQEWQTLQPIIKKPVDSTFTASQVSYSLSFCDNDPAARKIRDRLAEYLIEQREAPGVWRYHGRISPVSPDIDDTSMGWVALKRNGQSIAPEALEALRANRNKAGVFNTWIGPTYTWTNVDSTQIDTVANLNVLLAFGVVGEYFDAVCEALITHVEKDRFRAGSTYYPSPLSFTFAFSRAYAEGGVNCLAKAVPKIKEACIALQQQDGGWGDDYETATGLLTLLNLGEKGEAIERGISLLVGRQGHDGSWALAPIYKGERGRWRYGSKAVTTALCVEALVKYQKR